MAAAVSASHSVFAQEIQVPFARPVDAQAAPQDQDDKLVLLGVQGGTLAQLPLGPGDTFDATAIPFVGVEPRLSFPWPYPGGADLSHGLGFSVDYGDGRAATGGSRDERIALFDATYFMAYPLRKAGSYAIIASARTGVSGMGVWPSAPDAEAEPFLGLLVGMEFAIQLMGPPLRFGLAGDARALSGLRGLPDVSMLMSLGLRMGWTFVR
ncbi:MAG: hypothetical protein U0414_37325 [Polyangiaceae bacterium]